MCITKQKMEILNINSYCFIVYFLLLLSSASAINDVGILNLYKTVSYGDGTYYGNKQGGSCTLNVPHLPPVASRVDRLVALNAPQMFGSSACGMCLRVNGSGQGLGHSPITGSYIVYVKDICPECKPGDVDFAVEGDGRWKVSMKAVQCPVAGLIEYKLQGSNNYYIKLQIRNDRIPTTTLRMFQPIHNTWTEMFRTRDGYWEFPRNDNRIDKPIARPIKLLLYSPNGQVLYDEIHPRSMEFKGIIHGRGVQYRFSPDLPSA
ncbi:uncharacterized protein LOC123565273 [Mercenaria mercenaria]|uniref:uncharacterized protein LOC123565273 n=1 Tax=Mercenaria mercenaria TaxID=6596 RepID=UPI00234FAF56|nr:uncharacterized protein LOC123565273 [Mercenaria mercenaria]